MSIDLASVQDALNGLRSATVAQLAALVQSAVDAESLSIDIAYRFNLPGGSGRESLYARLQSHLATLRAEPDQTHAVVDPALSTVKADVVSACIDLNATVEGQGVEQQARDRIFSDMADNARGLVAGFGNILSGAVSGAELVLVVGGVIAIAVILWVVTRPKG